ncbi:MAG TPA: autotransporter-associated beta strand repeat-containing protein, partial [Verrucomicrobiae bacterium]|nr:autotransporter-associated beta strand repeat-containing protein [Verrucomicrobiae bacterium]
WDGTNTTADADGGNGTWDNLTTPNWDDAATAGNSVTWDNTAGDTANFGGTAGTVLFGGDITAAGIDFSTAGYSLNLGVGQTLTVNNISASGGGTSFIIGTTGTSGNHFVNNGGSTLTIQTATSADRFSFATIGGGNQRHINIIGTGGLDISGPGYVNMRVISNAGTGQVNISGGATVLINNGNSPASTTASLGTGNINIAGGVLEGYFTGSFRNVLGAGNTQLQMSGVSGFSGNGNWDVRLNNNTNTVTWGSTFFNVSTLVLQAETAGSASTLTFRNGLDLSGSNRTVTNLSSSGAIADMVGVISNSTGTAGLTKQGAGELRLSAVNTYNGDTFVDDGTLTLSTNAELLFAIGALGENNAILGDASNATLNLNGILAFNLSGASTTAGDFWNIVDVGNLTETYDDATFSVRSINGGSFTETANVWTIEENGTTYSFAQDTGILSVVPEPSAALLGGLGCLLLLRRRRA